MKLHTCKLYILRLINQAETRAVACSNQISTFITIILLIDHWDYIPNDKNRRILMKNHVAEVIYLFVCLSNLITHHLPCRRAVWVISITIRWKSIWTQNFTESTSEQVADIADLPIEKSRNKWERGEAFRERNGHSSLIKKNLSICKIPRISKFTGIGKKSVIWIWDNRV